MGGVRILATAGVVWVTWSTAAVAAEPYCEGNPAVIYCEDFEGGNAGMLSTGEAATVVSADSGAPVYDGNYALLADFTPPYSAQAEFGYRFAGVERVYMRFFVRFDASWDEPMHHWYALHGDRADDEWSCHGDAGCRPNGTLCLSGTTVDTREAVDGELPGEPFFYTYHPDMSCDPEASCANYADPQAICDGCANKGLPCESGLECCWGNWFDINQGGAVSMQQDTWYEIETMVAANTPGVADGEMALWIDGELVAEHTGIRWRDTDELLLNHAIFWNYYRSVSATRQIWYDNLVLSTEPIGAPGGGDDGGTADDGPADDSGDGGPADDSGGGGDGSPGDGADGADQADGAGDGGASDDGTGTGTGAAADGAGDEGDGGCGCSTAPRSAGLWAWIVLALGARRRPLASRSA